MMQVLIFLALFSLDGHATNYAECVQDHDCPRVECYHSFCHSDNQCYMFPKCA